MPDRELGELYVQSLDAVEAIGVTMTGRQKWTLRLLVGAFALVLLVLVILVGLVLGVTSDTNDALKGQVIVLQDQHDADLKTIADLKSVVDQAVNAIIADCNVFTTNGIECPRYVIKPPDDEPPQP